MVFSSTVFLFLFLFLPLALAVYYNPLWKGRAFRNGFLLLASLGFYAWGEPVFVFIMALAIAVNWALVLAMARHKERRRRKRWLVAAIGFDMAVSTTACWRRWHLSLSTWFRDYMCIPPGDNRAAVAGAAVAAWAKPEGCL
jgi:D-alanyl-lipoteichoic acid acyltransferase DltB (MBOAT superfamily)